MSLHVSGGQDGRDLAKSVVLARARGGKPDHIEVRAVLGRARQMAPCCGSYQNKGRAQG